MLGASRAALMASGGAYLANVSFLLHMDGTNGSTTFTDSGPNGLTVGAYGNAQISTAQSVFGGASALFDGNGDYLKIAANAALDPGTGDFTLQWRQWLVSYTGYPTAFDFGYTAATALLLQCAEGTGRRNVWYGGTLRITEGSAPALNAWYHYALVRSGTTLTLYRDGTAVGSYTGTIVDLTGHDVGIGASLAYAPLGVSNGDYSLNGYIDEMALHLVALYTADFTPPSAPY
jgi:hypothetical protein